ncbi:hypothetical protein ACFQHV_18610 [Promicromonospora thailandica]|uniref:LPXTG-motif cell wall-anchored protein n=2 Tax=Promicromonospora thailandica TaxID=765201 RepID=A0A9X2G465_9MICO|nr:hypothetical protein [Promicromonospora thailandica]
MAAPASAHTPSVSADCGFVNVDLKYYSGANVTVVIDGETREDTEFSNGFQGRYDNLALDAAHDWTVTVDAYDNDKYDWTQSGSIPACQTPPPAEFVSPVIPEAVAGCAASLDDVVLPESTEAITYSKSEAGIVATLTSDAYAFPEDLGAYVLQPDGTALLPTELVVLEEDCAEPTPSPEPSEEPVVEPSEEASVPAAEPSASPSPAAEEPPVLAATGATVGGAVAFAALLAAGGVALVWARKRMQQNA